MNLPTADDHTRRPTLPAMKEHTVTQPLPAAPNDAADIARQVDMLASDPDLLSAWMKTCDPYPLGYAALLRALAEKLHRPTAAEVTR